MMGKTHLAGGLALGITIERATYIFGMPLISPDSTIAIGGNEISAIILAIGAAGLGSLLPDIDEPNSMVSNLPRVSKKFVNQTLKKKGIEGYVRSGIGAVLMLLNLGTRALSGVVKIFAMGHRAATHWLVTGIIISLLVSGLGFFLGFTQLGLWLGIGYVSHLLMDMMTLSGVEVFQPLSEKKYHVLPRGFRVRTGSVVDSLIAISCSAVMGIFVYISFVPDEIWERILG